MTPRLPLLLLPAALCLTTGCTLTWLPDSSGFLYAVSPMEGRATRLVRYDLAKKASAVIVEDTKTRTILPGVSADGKRIAVADYTRHTRAGSKVVIHKFRVVTYGLAGKELARTKVIEANHVEENAAATTAAEQGQAMLDWSGPPDKVLIYLNPFSGIKGIVDLKRETFQEIKGLVMGLDRHVRPDGKGFVAHPPERPNPLRYYGWDGKWKDLDSKPVFARDDDGPVNWAWSRGTLRATTANRVIDIDTEKGTSAARPNPMKLDVGKGRLRDLHPFPGGEAFLCLVGEGMKSRLEFRRPARKLVKVITTSDEHKFDDFSFKPSPDGKHVAIICGDIKREHGCVLVIDAAGAIAHGVAIE